MDKFDLKQYLTEGRLHESEVYSLMDYENMLDLLKVNDIPCSIKLTNDGKIEVHVGFDAPDELSNQVFNARDELKLSEVEVMAYGGDDNYQEYEEVNGGYQEYDREDYYDDNEEDEDYDD